jgi:hypothetical protein
VRADLSRRRRCAALPWNICCECADLSLYTDIHAHASPTHVHAHASPAHGVGSRRNTRLRVGAAVGAGASAGVSKSGPAMGPGAATAADTARAGTGATTPAAASVCPPAATPKGAGRLSPADVGASRRTLTNRLPGTNAAAAARTNGAYATVTDAAGPTVGVSVVAAASATAGRDLARPTHLKCSQQGMGACAWCARARTERQSAGAEARRAQRVGRSERQQWGRPGQEPGLGC